MYKKSIKYYNYFHEYPTPKGYKIRKCTKLTVGLFIIYILKYLLAINEIFILSIKKRFHNKQSYITLYFHLNFFVYSDFTKMGYYRARRRYTITINHLWKYIKYLHLLNKEDKELFINYMEFLIDYWILCDNIKTYHHYITTNNLIYSSLSQSIFKESALFSKSNIIKFLDFDNPNDLYILNKTIFRD